MQVASLTKILKTFLALFRFISNLNDEPAGRLFRATLYLAPTSDIIRVLEYSIRHSTEYSSCKTLDSHSTSETMPSGFRMGRWMESGRATVPHSMESRGRACGFRGNVMSKPFLLVSALSHSQYVPSSPPAATWLISVCGLPDIFTDSAQITRVPGTGSNFSNPFPLRTFAT